MKVGDTVKLRALQGAVSRTKNRIRENGTSFIVRSEAQTCRFDRGARLWISFESTAHRASDGKGGKEAWVGWLPKDEVENAN